MGPSDLIGGVQIMETKKPRRAIGNFTARKNTKNSWQIQIDHGRDSITGKRLRAYENLKGTRREAERRLSALLIKLESGDHIQQSTSRTSQNGG